MTLTDIGELLTNIVKNYGSAIIGACGAIVAAAIATVYGGRELTKYMRHRMAGLEETLRAAEKELSAKEADNVELDQDNAQLKDRCSGLEVQLDRLKTAFDGQNPWMRAPFDVPARYHAHMKQSIPILLIANLKGGVGKTTLAANLVPYFERQHGERVLAIDLDYQGSLSSMLVAAPFNERSSAKCVIDLLSGGEAATVVAGSRPVRDSLLDSRVVECDHAFADFEMRLLIQWLSGDVGNDIRYNLARVLQSADIQKNFNRVIIDAPPRITTGFINALAASTDLVVPFVLDLLSAERVGLFLGQLNDMRPLLCPHLKLAAALIPRKQDISKAAGQRLAYIESRDAQALLDPVGRELFARSVGGQNADHFVSQAAH
jgi:cellulose biosynthesis protein BcsQ